MCVVLLLQLLLARHPEVVASNSNNIVTAIRGGVIDGLMLAHQVDGDRGSQTAERTRVRSDIDIVPGAGIRETSLRNIVSV